ncbi:hypothetical protein ACTZWW_04380 [Salinarimonas sp. NSM]|uniref:hypothetical protein n=1 Tax=Salinarimonas sp. NSM TaxID=3458003 RepID=UPI00403613A1
MPETLPETVTLTLTRAQLAAVRGALDHLVATCRDQAAKCEAEADAVEIVVPDPQEAEARTAAARIDCEISAARWTRLADEAASALAVVEAAAERVILDTHAA